MVATNPAVNKLLLKSGSQKVTHNIIWFYKETDNVKQCNSHKFAKGEKIRLSQVSLFTA